MENKKVRVAQELIESIWSAYPRKQGKKMAEPKIKKLIEKYGYDIILLTVQRYAELVVMANMEYQFIPYGSTFFNSTIYDYLDEHNFSEIAKKVVPQPKEEPKPKQDYREEWF